MGIDLVDGSWGDVPGLVMDKEGRIIVLRRGEPPIIEFDSSGKVLKAWGRGLIAAPHGLFLDHEGFLWVTDAPYGGATPEQKKRGQQVFKFSREGKLMMTLGKSGVAGDGPDTFNQPSHLVVAPTGEIFVADGHGSDSKGRVDKFSKDGKFIKAWGKPGSAPGEFSSPHAIAMDSQGRIFVADRSNRRIQIFDQDGVLLDIWMQFGGVSGLYIAPDDTLYAANASDTSPLRGIVIGNAKTGAVTRLIEDVFPESIAATAAGIIYVGEAGRHRSKEPVKHLMPMPRALSQH
jgi:DNA-binding beta-propeller fold protein YncE